VSMSPTRTPLPRFTEYEPLLVAPIARMSHWHALSESGPTAADTPYSEAQAAASAAAVFVPSGGAAAAVVWATPRIDSVAAAPTSRRPMLSFRITWSPHFIPRPTGHRCFGRGDRTPRRARRAGSSS